MRTVSGTLRPANINWLPVLSNIEPPQIRRDRATLQEYKKAHQLTDCVPIKEILREPTMSRLRSRRPFVAEAAWLASLNQTEQQTWEQSCIEGVPPGHDVVTNPTCPQPGFTLPRRQFFTLNRLRCGQARCAESLYRWGVIASPACPCGESHKAHCWRVPTHCIPWRPATSTRSRFRRSGMVIKTVYETVRVFQTNNNNIHSALLHSVQLLILRSLLESPSLCRRHPDLFFLRFQRHRMPPPPPVRWIRDCLHDILQTFYSLV